MKNAQIAVVLTMLCGCTDPAEAPYKACEAAEKAGNVRAAASACSSAQAAASSSKYGKLAAEKLQVIQPALDRLDAEERAASEKRIATMQAEAAAEAEKAEKALDAACSSHKWVTYCQSGGGMLKAATHADCQKDVDSMLTSMGVKCAPCKCSSEVLGQ